MNPSRSRSLAHALAPSLAARLALVVALTGCGGDGGGPAAPRPDATPLVLAEMVLVDEAGTMMYSHRDHWHGFPVVPAGRQLTLQQFFVARSGGADDHEPPPQAEWFTLATHADVDLRVVVTDTTVGRWSGDKVRGTLDGRRVGSSVVSHVVRRGATTLKEVPPLNFVVR
jgi:hypothetical protein